jgi:thiol-disulfide isomerase/thioredoxin
LNARKTIGLSLCAVLLCTATVHSVAGTRTEEALASHPLKSLDGNEVTLSTFEGDVVIVNFWASWCPPCRKELPVMDEWHTSWQNRGGRVVAISIDKDLRKVQRFVEKEALSMTVLHDGPSGLAKTIDLPSLPCTYLLDRSGKVIAVFTSSDKNALRSLHQKAEALLGSPRVQSANMMNGSEGDTP